MAANGTLDWALVPQYIVGQMLGGFLGAAFLIVLFHDQLKRTEDSVLKRGCFCTAPGIRNYWRNALSEITCSFVLVFAILGIGSTAAGVSAVNYLFVYAIIVSIGMSFGGLTGYSMNAARDFSPRVAFALFCPGKDKDPDWAYSWIPSIMPLIGGLLAVALYHGVTLAP
jgi:glycerol uptake facilitator protein